MPSTRFPFLKFDSLQILTGATVVFVAVWQPDKAATEQQQKAGRGEWVCAAIQDMLTQPELDTEVPYESDCHRSNLLLEFPSYLSRLRFGAEAVSLNGYVRGVLCTSFCPDVASHPS
jgi:hypothetical protein